MCLHLSNQRDEMHKGISLLTFEFFENFTMVRFWFQKSLSTTSLINKIIGGFVILAVLLFSALINPIKVGLFTCAFHEKTGYNCPTCGLSRSFHAISHLNIQESFKFHPLGPIVYLVLLFLLVKFAFEILSRTEIQIKLNSIITRMFFIILMTLWISLWLIQVLDES